VTNANDCVSGYCDVCLDDLSRKDVDQTPISECEIGWLIAPGNGKKGGKVHRLPPE
jgi:hypothetical protein